MKNILNKISFIILVGLMFSQVKINAQALVPPTPYCFPLYSQIPCNQPGPSNSAGNFINDFINSFSTTGGVSNITNNNSGCNAQNFIGTGIRNYFYFGCSQYLVANPGQVITCTFQSGNVYAQGMTCFIDWNQNGVYNLPGERVCSIAGVPPAASFNSANFTVPIGQAPGVYRMRVRCAYATSGPLIDPCNNYGYGETEEYNVYISTTPAGVVTATASTSTPSLCAGQTISLSVVGSGTSALSYTWTGPGSYSSTTQNPVIPNATATMSGVYNVTVSPGSCPATGSVNILVTNYPTYTVAPMTVTVCQGGIFTPSVILGTLPGTPCSTVGVGPACASPPLFTVGTSATFNSSWQTPSPYNKYYYDHHQQILYRASELLASGVSAGYLTSLAFDVATTNGVSNMANYTIKIKCTTNSVVTAFDNAGLTQVFSQALLTPVVGWNTHTFTTPYYWDGVSNILVDICRSSTPWTFVNSSVRYTSTTYNSTIWGGGTNATIVSCGGTNSNGLSMNRSNTRFGNCVSVLPTNFTYSWSPGPGIAAPTATSTQITTQPITGTLATVFYSIVVTPTVYSCPTLQTLTVTVINPLSPTITPLPPLCNTSGTVALIATPGGGSFTTNSAISAPGIVTPSLAAIGTSTVLYTVGVGSCIATNTAAISVSQFNTANLTGSIVPLCVTSPTQNLMALVQSTVNGIWSGLGVTSNVFDPATGGGNYILTYNTTSSPNPTVCPSSSTLAVSVTATLVPTITPVNPICTNASPVTLNANPSGGNWFGNAGVSTAGIFTPSLTSIGLSIVNYSVNVGPCVVTNTTTLDVSQYNTAALTGLIANMCNTFTPVSLFSIVQSTVNGSWSGTGVSANVFNPNLATGIYTVTYNTTSAPNATLCPDVQTTTISVLNPPQPTISQVGPYCNNAPNFQLIVSPTSGTWTPTLYNNTSGTFSPALATIGNNVVQYVVGTSTCNVQDTKTISIEAYVPAVITGSVPDLCVTSSPVSLFPITTNNLGVWSGSGVLGTIFDPATSGVGSILLTYTTASSPSGLCPAQATTAVNVYSLALPAITPVGPFCNTAAPLQLQVSPLGGVFGGANNGATTPIGGFNPAFAIIGNNIINYSVTSGPCIAFAQTTISIEKFISADFAQYAGPYCRNDAPINLNSIVQNPGGTWTGPGVVGSLFTPANANIGNNNVITYLTHSMPTAGLCPDTSSVRIQVNEIPVVSVVSNTEKGCSPVEVIFNTPSANTGSGQWNLGDGSDPVSGLTVTHIYTTPGSYTITFNYQDEIGCSTQAILSHPIDVYEMPRANFNYNPDEVTIANPEVQFSNLSTILGNNTYQWQISNLYQLNDVNPKVIFPSAGDYEIILTATTIHGCKDVVSKVVQVLNDYGIYIPTSFTPNFDGLNDYFIPVFSPYGLDLKTYDMEVFDRWGHSMFHTKDFTKGWDGTVNNKGDEILKQDVYVYKVRFKDIDGKIHNKTGHVTLMK
ncbi:MAG: PKD domain-containing protein [Bacteroidota bacterium]|nr:PKD domain-containing protein [Bacteroidota bacterium]